MNIVQKARSKVVQLRPQIKRWYEACDSLEEFIDEAYIRIEELGEEHGISVELREQIIQKRNEIDRLEDMIDEAHKVIDSNTEFIDKELTKVYNLHKK